MRAYRIKTYNAVIVPPTMLLVALGLLVALALNWIRDRPNLDKITLSMLLTVALIVVLSPIVRSVAGSGRTHLSGALGLLYVTALSTNLNVVAHYNGNGIQQSLALCVILAVASTFFWAWEWQLVFGLLGSMGPPVVTLFVDNYSTDERYIFAQVVAITIITCVAFYIYLRHTNMRSYSLMMEVEYRAAYDGLTGLLNRTEWFELAGKAVRGAESANQPCALLFVDLDRFKILNDREGHVAGDRMLKQIANVLRETGDAGELIGRFGGDEFVILIPHAGMDQASVRAARIRETLDTAPDLPLEVTASVGIAIGEPGDDLDLLVHRADEAMFAAKAETRVVA
jgi:diguanylate cyclase (GGDEF)-like protein